jgi:hypothetical protein
MKRLGLKWLRVSLLFILSIHTPPPQRPPDLAALYFAKSHAVARHLYALAEFESSFVANKRVHGLI